MKKNKTVAYMMAAMLLVGGTFAGTKAWFTAKETVDTSFEITTGSIDIETKDKGWVVTTPEGEKTEMVVRPGSGMNFKPGDSLEKEVTIKNIGELAQKLEINRNNVKENDNFKVSIQGLEKDQILAVEDSITFTIRVEADLEKMDNEDANKIFNLKDIVGTIDINAKQINARD
ncbi:hypothetical protein [Paeniclostridium hominis]|uniref:hypothetical protein n=1 Tax=Paeniclostridium hominis TaxID=2764329 RepID=UPI0022E40E01|nr:hypothetical protein [Paeniclostridium hominis]